MKPVLIAYASWLVFVLTWNVFDGSAATVATAGARRERLHSLVISLGLVLLVLAPATLVKGRTHVNPPLLDWTMLLIMEAGIAWCWWARRHLGRLWSAAVMRKEGHRVVDTGPYRFVRHPIYTGFIVIYVGMAIISTSVLAYLAVPLIALGLWLKARVEEQFLIEQLGREAYDAYGARTPMLVPRIQRRSKADMTVGNST
jgi:protein-S-isoprenylcysteine O-methyltransferase Ste14